MTDALISIALAPASGHSQTAAQRPLPESKPSLAPPFSAVPNLQTVIFVPLRPRYEIMDEEDTDNDPNDTNRVIESLTQAAQDPNDTPLPPPDFKIDGLWQQGIVINGELRHVGQTIGAWTIKAVNKETDTVLLQQKQHVVRIQVE